MAKILTTKDDRKVMPYHKSRGYVADPSVMANTISEIEQSDVQALQEFAADDGLLDEVNMAKLYHRVPNQFNDPISVYFALDAIIQSAPLTYIRSHELRDWLNQNVPHIYWTPGVLGRILAGLNSAAYTTYVGDPEFEGTEPYIIVKDEDQYDDKALLNKQLGMVPFAQARDNLSRFYGFDPQGGNEGRLWMMQLRKRVLAVAKLQRAADSEGDFDEFFAKASSAQTAFSVFYHDDEMSEDPIPAVRSPRAYRHQLLGENEVRRRNYEDTRDHAVALQL